MHKQCKVYVAILGIVTVLISQHFLKRGLVRCSTSNLFYTSQLGSLETEPLSCLIYTTQHWYTTTCPTDAQNYISIKHLQI